MLAQHPDKHKILREVQAGNLEALTTFKTNNPEVHWLQLRYNKTGDTVLHIAAMSGHLDIIKFLLYAYSPSAIDCKNNDGKTALHEACQFAQYDIVKLLIAKGADVNALKRSDWTPLMLACTKVQADSFKIVELLLKSGALINYANKDGWSSVHLICREGNVEILGMLHRYAAELEKLTKNKRTPLHIAALHGHFACVEYLLATGVKIDPADSCGNTPLHEAVSGGSREVCDLLINAGVEVCSANNAGFGLLHLAASEGHLCLLKFFAAGFSGLDFNKQSSDGFTPLHCAARKKQFEAFKFLMNLGANESICDNLGRRANHYMSTG